MNMTNKHEKTKLKLKWTMKTFWRVFPRSVYRKELLAFGGCSDCSSLWTHETLAKTTRRKAETLHDGCFIVRWERTPTKTINGEFFHGRRTSPNRTKNITFGTARAYTVFNTRTHSYTRFQSRSQGTEPNGYPDSGLSSPLRRLYFYE